MGGIADRPKPSDSGTYQFVEKPNRLEQTCHMVGMPEVNSVVEYALSQVDAGARLTLRHTGFISAEQCARNCLG